ncbi:MAG TPA: sugar kinase [Candidatus Thermoplasmatota archaeon]|nr:sugar kinase [Candidatus Thermoplasmatota archaeon]
MTVEPARAAAFAPGHVTGIFEIHDQHADPERRGSRGAGFSLAQGALTYVEVAPADALAIDVTLDREPAEAATTREAVTALLKEAVKLGKVPLNRDAPKGSRARIRVRVATELQLPVSQGFGMSAAGALSAALALAKCLRMGRTDAVRAAHVAEVAHRTGLGDVVGAALGGFEVRVKPGLPPWGLAQTFVGYGDAVLCVIGGRLETKAVLSDPARRQAVNDAGGRALDALLTSPSLPLFLEQSQRFARESGLLTPDMERAMHAAKAHGHASMSMLGHSLFAFGNVPRLVDALSPFGEVRVVPVSEAGARLVDVSPAPGA